MVKHSGADLDATFAALADPTRRAFLEQLAHGRSSPGILAEPHDISLPAVSKHLRVLERAGLLMRRKQGRTQHCVLLPGPLEQAAAWFGHHRTFWERQLDSLQKFLEQNAIKEASSWHRRSRVPTSRSGSRARSGNRGKKSSRRGPTRRR